MLLIFATKRSANGNRRYILIDTEARSYATDYRRPIWRDELQEISAKDLQRLTQQLERENFNRVDYLG